MNFVNYGKFKRHVSFCLLNRDKKFLKSISDEKKKYNYSNDKSLLGGGGGGGGN